jgi:Domain of unknown function (DUF4276)
VALKKTIELGILAEEQNDVDVMSIVVRRMSPGTKIGVRQFLGHGCGKLRNKCRDWAQQLKNRGCSTLLLVHDLDRASLPELRATLSGILSPNPFAQSIILIPVEELEAWLMSDPNALKKAFSLKKIPKCPGNPETVANPKEMLRDLIWKESGKEKRYRNTVHNARIAEHVALNALRRCSIFRDFEREWTLVRTV